MRACQYCTRILEGICLLLVLVVTVMQLRVCMLLVLQSEPLDVHGTVGMLQVDVPCEGAVHLGRRCGYLHCI